MKEPSCQCPLPPEVRSAVEILVDCYTENSPQPPQGTPWEIFLAVLRSIPNIAVACRVASVARSTAYAKRQSDAEFDRAWDDAWEEGVDQLEAAAFQRAAEGVDMPVSFQSEDDGYAR